MRCCDQKSFLHILTIQVQSDGTDRTPAAAEIQLSNFERHTESICLCILCSGYKEELWLYSDTNWYVDYIDPKTRPAVQQLKNATWAEKKKKKNCYSICNEPPVEKRKRSVLSMFDDCPFFFFVCKKKETSFSLCVG